MSAPAPPRAPRPQIDARFRARRRAVAAESVRRRRRLVSSLIGALMLIVGAVALSYSPLFAVDDVRVLGVEAERAAVVRTVAAVTPGERLLSVDLGTVTSEVSALPWVREVAVSRVPPSTIELAVAARVPVAVVVLESASWLVDEHGVVVGGGTAADLPRIIAPQSVLPGPGGEVVDVAVRNALAVHLALPDEVVAQVDVYDAPSDRGLRLHLADDVVWARVGLADRVPQKGQVISLLLEQLREQALLEGEQELGIAELDVRAPDNPVLIPGDGSLGEEHREAIDPTSAEGDEADSIDGGDQP